jgi:hypothetical protein
MRIELVTEVMVLPTGMALEDLEQGPFALLVQWRGVPEDEDRARGGYRVTDGFRELSRAGKWDHPQRFQQWQYRWVTQAEALEAARAAVDHLKINGRTWAEWNAL